MKAKINVRCLASAVGIAMATFSYLGFSETMSNEQNNSSSSEPCRRCESVHLSSWSGQGANDTVCKDLAGNALRDCLLLECDKAKSKNNLVFGPNPVCPATNGACSITSNKLTASAGTCTFYNENDALVNEVDPLSGELNDSGCNFYQFSDGLRVSYGNICEYQCIKDNIPGPTPTPTPNPNPTPIPTPTPVPSP